MEFQENWVYDRLALPGGYFLMLMIFNNRNGA